MSEDEEEKTKSDERNEEKIEEPIEKPGKMRFYQEIGKMGGEKRKQELGHEGYQKLGKMGGEAVKKRHGHESLEEVKEHHRKGED